MTNFNLHTHTCFSDGSDVPEKYCEEALGQGFETLGFTDHAPVPFENTFAIKPVDLGNYFRDIIFLKEKYSLPEEEPRLSGQPERKNSQGKNLNILLGLEIDYIPGITEPLDFYRRNYPIDYLIGSVHLVKNAASGKLWFIDGPDISIYDEGLQDVFGGNIRLAVTAYYRQLQSLILDHQPDIVGHMDKIKMYNRDRYFSENDDWYVSLVDETLDMIWETGCVVEINTRGLYKKRAETFFPGPDIMKKIRKLNIPVTLVSDAHKPHELSLGFVEAVKTMKMLGFEKTFLMTADGWQERPLG